MIRNPRPRVDGAVLMIGPTHGGRVLTVVLDPDPLDDDTWGSSYCMGREPCADQPLRA